MQATLAQEMSIRINSIDQLFNAPDLNPFSDKEIDVMGEPALMRVVKRKLTHGMRNWKETRLIIKLPADQITPGCKNKPPRRSTAFPRRRSKIMTFKFTYLASAVSSA